MAIKYICDFCGGEAPTHTFVGDGDASKKVLCKNCLGHLEKQTWRLAEEPAEYEKKMKALKEKEAKLEDEISNWTLKVKADGKMSYKYQNALRKVLSMYNDVVELLDSYIPTGFLHRRKPFQKIDIPRFKIMEEEAIHQSYDEAMRENMGQFSPYYDGDIYKGERESLSDLPLFPWNKDN